MAPEFTTDTKHLQNDRDVILAFVKNKGSLQYASEVLRADRFIVTTAVERDGLNLEFASDELQSDTQIVLKSIENDSSSFQYASLTLRDTEDIALEAVSRSGQNLQFASKKCQANKEIVLRAVENWPDSLKHASEQLRDELEIVYVAVSNDMLIYKESVLQFASDRLRDNAEIVLPAVTRKGAALKHASDNCRNDSEIVIAAIKNASSAIKYIGDELRLNQDFIIRSVQENADVIFYINLNNYLNFHDIILHAIDSDGYILTNPLFYHLKRIDSKDLFKELILCIIKCYPLDEIFIEDAKVFCTPWYSEAVQESFQGTPLGLSKLPGTVVALEFIQIENTDEYFCEYRFGMSGGDLYKIIIRPNTTTFNELSKEICKINKYKNITFIFNNTDVFNLKDHDKLVASIL